MSDQDLGEQNMAVINYTLCNMCYDAGQLVAGPVELSVGEREFRLCTDHETQLLTVFGESDEQGQEVAA